MSREVLFVAGMGEVAQAVPVFRQLAGLISATQTGVTYIDGVEQQAGYRVVVTPEQQAATLAAKVNEITERRPGTAFRLIAHDLGALPTVHFLAAENPNLDATAYLISPRDVTPGEINDDFIKRNSTYEKASIIAPHLDQLGMFGEIFPAQLEELSDEGNVKLIYVASERKEGMSHSDGPVTNAVSPQDVLYVAGSPTVGGGLDRPEVRKLLRTVLYL